VHDARRSPRPRPPPRRWRRLRLGRGHRLLQQDVITEPDRSLTGKRERLSGSVITSCWRSRWPGRAGGGRHRLGGGRGRGDLRGLHVLRYTPYTRMGSSGCWRGPDRPAGQRAAPGAGRLVAPPHSFVRGNWRNEAESGPMLLTKSCQTSTGWCTWSARHPPGSARSAASRISGRRAPGRSRRPLPRLPVETTCPYSAKRLYLGTGRPGAARVAAGGDHRRVHEQAVLTALRGGPYGRCVYASDNDVVDHQV